MNSEKDYIIFPLEDGGLYVIVTSRDRDNTYWKALSNEISVKAKKNSLIRFDFLCRNGFSNRFFTAILDDNILKPNSLRRAKLGKKYEDISQNYFLKNPNFILESVMTPLQKKQFLCKKSNNHLKLVETKPVYQICAYQTYTYTEI